MRFGCLAPSVLDQRHCVTFPPESRLSTLIICSHFITRSSSFLRARVRSIREGPFGGGTGGEGGCPLDAGGGGGGGCFVGFAPDLTFRRGTLPNGDAGTSTRRPSARDWAGTSTKPYRSSEARKARSCSEISPGSSGKTIVTRPALLAPPRVRSTPSSQPSP